MENTVLLRTINDEVDFLDTIMGSKYERQPEKLRAWESASRVERAPVKARKDKPATASTPAPAPTQPSRVPVLQPA